MIELMVCLAVCLVVPLGLGLISPARPDPAFRLLRIAHPVAALLVVISFCLEKGPLAAGLAAPWLLLTLLGALSGTSRVLRSRFRDPAELCFGAGLALLPVGAVHLLLSRLGATVMDFREPIILLTAIHFHYTAFAAPVLAGMAIQRFPQHGRLLRPASLGLLTGTPLLAAGFVFSPLLRYVAVLLLCASLLTLALVQMANLTRLDAVRDGLSRTLLALSAVGLACGMLLAAVFGSGEYAGHARIGIPRMALLHGVSNGILFCLLGLLGWQREGAR